MYYVYIYLGIIGAKSATLILILNQKNRGELSQENPHDTSSKWAIINAGLVKSLKML